MDDQHMDDQQRDEAGNPRSAGGAPRARASATRYAWLSIAAALTTMAMKGVAAWLTGSVALLSDAVESSVNLVAAVVALVALSVAARPADESHEFGHSKAEYFSAAFEGMMIVVAAGLISWQAIDALIDPRELEDLGIGIVVTIVASLVNLGVGLVLRSAGRRLRSIALEADSRHLLTDVVTSAGVVVGVALVAVTGWDRLDPIVALLVAANIVWAGFSLVRRSSDALMDASVPSSDRVRIDAVLERYRSKDIEFHALRTRQAGRRSFAVVHLLVPGDWTVQRSHDLADEVERALTASVPGLRPTIHVEPIEDPASLTDIDLDRTAPDDRPQRPGNEP